MLSGLTTVPFGPQPLISAVTTPTAPIAPVTPIAPTAPTSPTAPVSGTTRYYYPLTITVPTGPLKSPTGTGVGTSGSPVSGVGTSGSPVSPLGPPSFGGPYTPAEMRQAYGFDKVYAQYGWDGTGQTIAIVDAFDDTSIKSDLMAFDSLFGLPAPPTFTQVNPEGTSGGEDSGWDGEMALDVEWAHAIAPGANILLVEANTNSGNDLENAVKYATTQPGVHQVSMSYGGGEYQGEQSSDSIYDHPGITYFASAGDDGTQVNSPAVSPYVTSVGGTSLFTDSSGNYSQESVWGGSGGGYSSYETLPAYQSGFVNGTKRGVPDVSYDADPNTGVYFVDQGQLGAVGGTSASSPQWAGLMALANQGRAEDLLPSVGTGFKFGTNTELYTLAGNGSYNTANRDFHDVTTGSNGLPATTGWDPSTGLGTPVANFLVPDLVGTKLVPVVNGAVVDSGFEDTSVGTGSGGYSYDPVGLGWNYVGTAGISGNGSAITSSNPASPQGSQVGFIQSTGSINQTVPGVLAGTYQIYFSAAQRANYQVAQQNIEVMIDGTNLGVFTPTSTSYRGTTTPTFTLTAGSHKITILGVDSAGGDNTVLLDNVTLGAISAGATPTVGDASFETVNTTGVLGSYVADPTTSAWTFTGTAGVAAGTNSAFTTGNPIAPNGSNVAYLEDTGKFTQAVSGFAAGTYQVTFADAQRASSQSVRQDFEVLVDGTVAGTYTPLDATYQGDTTPIFTLAAGAHTISFVGLDSAGGDNTALIDNVVLSQVILSATPTAKPLPVPPPLPDAGFETDKMTSGFLADPTGSSWTFAGTAGISANGSTYTATNAVAPQGSQVAYLENGGSFSQSIGSWKAGTFLISFQDAQRASNQSIKEDFEVLIDGVVISTISPTSSSYLTNWTAPFTVTAGAHTVSFVGLDSAGGDNTALIDGINIVAST